MAYASHRHRASYQLPLILIDSTLSRDPFGSPESYMARLAPGRLATVRIPDILHEVLVSYTSAMVGLCMLFLRLVTILQSLMRQRRTRCIL